MNPATKIGLSAYLRTLQAGINENIKPTDVVVLAGTTYTGPTQLSAKIDGYLAAQANTVSAKAAFHEAVTEEEESNADARIFRGQMEGYAIGRYGKDSPVIAKLGFATTARKEPSAAVKAVAVLKNKKTRVLRGTDTKAERAKLKGQVDPSILATLNGRMLLPRRRRRPRATPDRPWWPREPFTCSPARRCSRRATSSDRRDAAHVAPEAARSRGVRPLAFAGRAGCRSHLHGHQPVHEEADRAQGPGQAERSSLAVKAARSRRAEPATRGAPASSSRAWSSPSLSRERPERAHRRADVGGEASRPLLVDPALEADLEDGDPASAARLAAGSETPRAWSALVTDTAREASLMSSRSWSSGWLVTSA